MRQLGRIVLVVWLCGLAGAAWAEKRVALVFSASRYEFIRPLDNPRNDADLVEEALTRLGFEVTAESDRDLRRMRRALEDFAEDAKGADVALVYFAGHGVEIGGENRLLPVDANPASLEQLKQTSLPLEEVRAAAAAVAKSVVIVLDACRNDPFGATSVEGRGAVALGADVLQAAKPGLGRVGKAENTLFAFSAAPGETASDGSGDNSPFAAALAHYLPTDGLEIRSVLTLVQQEVYDETAGKQLPYVESGLPQMFFAAQTGPLPEREALLLAMADVTPDLRTEVERVATANAMPLAPLYGALISADLKTMSQSDRDRKLGEAAQAFVTTRDELKALASSDPEVTRLRAQAEKNLALGAFERARGNLAEAARIDAQSSDALAGKLVARRVSEADSYRATAGVALAQLDYPAAIAAYEQAAALHERIEGEDVADAARRKRDWILGDLGDLHARTGSSTKALDAYRRMESAANLRLKNAPDNDDAIRDVGLAMQRVGDMLTAQGNLAAALEIHERNLKMRGAQRNRMMERNDADWLSSIGVLAERIGDIRRQNGDMAGALDYYGTTLEFRRWLATNHNRNVQYRDGLIAILGRIGQIRDEQGDYAGAATIWREQLAEARKLASDFPDWTDGRLRLASALISMGDANAVAKQRDEALVAYGEAVTIARDILDRDPNVTQARYLRAQGLKGLGASHFAKPDPHAALAAYSDALAEIENLTRHDPENVLWRLYSARTMTDIGRVHYWADRYDEALNWYDRSAALLRVLVASDAAGRDNRLALLNTARSIGHARAFTGDQAGALSAFSEAAEMGRALQLESSRDKPLRDDFEAVLFNLAVHLNASGDRNAAVRTYAELIEFKKKVLAIAPDIVDERMILSHQLTAADLADNPRPFLEDAALTAASIERQGRLEQDDPTPGQLRARIDALR